MPYIVIRNYKNSEFMGYWNGKIYNSAIYEMPELWRLYIGGEPIHITPDQLKELQKNYCINRSAIAVSMERWRSLKFDGIFILRETEKAILIELKDEWQIWVSKKLIIGGYSVVPYTLSYKTDFVFEARKIGNKEETLKIPAADIRNYILSPEHIPERIKPIYGQEAIDELKYNPNSSV